MGTPAILQLAMGVLGGVGLFLLGMKFLSEGMQALAGPRLSRFVNDFTGNRMLALIAGILVTVVLQSSSATTVMVVGFVNSGLMTLRSAIGVSLGAQVGTTLSLWVLTLDVTQFGLLVIGLSAFLYLFAKRVRPHNAGRALLGLGLLFYGMQLMGDGFEPLRDNASVKALLARFDATSAPGFLLAMIVGMVVTGIIQSSAAMVVIVMSLGVNGIVNFPTAVALVLGSNIGTTVTALIACIGTSRNAVRAALGNTLTTVVGVLAAFLVHNAFADLCAWISRMIVGPLAVEDPAFVRVAVPCTHTVFNLVKTAVLLPFVPWFERMLFVILPATTAEKRGSERFRTGLDPRLIRSPALAVLQSRREILRMGEHCGVMLESLRSVLAETAPDPALEQSVFDAESDLDTAQTEISHYLGRILESGGAKLGDVAVAIRRQLRCADEFESVSDYVQNALKAILKIRDAGEKLSDVAVDEVKNLIDAVQAFRSLTLEVLDKAHPTLQELATAHEASRRITALAKEYRHRHFDRLEHACTGPVKGVIYNDLLADFRRMNEHLINAVETLEGK